MIGERLKMAREDLGFSQKDLAEKCGVTMRSQRNYEKGERQPDAAYLAALAALGADVLYVLTGQRSQVTETELKPDEEALLDNYRHTSKDQQAIIKATSDAFAQQGKSKKKTG